MADDALNKAGLFLDELNKVRLTKAEAAQNSSDLRDECADFGRHSKDLEESVESLLELMSKLAKAAEAEKLRAIGSRNALKTLAKERMAEQQQFQVLLRERHVEFERLQIELEALVRQETEQRDLIQQFLSPAV